MSDNSLNRRLNEDVVIFENGEASRTGAQLIAPDHSPREEAKTRALPPRGQVQAGAAVDLQRQVEQFLFHQSELLDGQYWQEYLDLFTADGVYWMPAAPEQTEWLNSPSIFAEDRWMMEVRRGRITHPNAWSQAPHWMTSHLVSNVAIEASTATQVQVRSRFHLSEYRRDNLRHFSGTYRHTLVRVNDDFRIKLQRVDLFNPHAVYDYVLQVWV
jgi:3-phenylpropionate/cinnamic acid dioxygenase small subunit